MRIAIPKETFPGERRVALVPSLIAPLAKAKLDVAIEAGAGEAAGFPDREYADKGAHVERSRETLLSAAEAVLQVRSLGANPPGWEADLAQMHAGQALIGMCEPLTAPGPIKAAADKGLSVFSLELMPRITRAQSMDVLSSMATVAGYKAVLLAAEYLPRMFPMLMTAAGTIAPARVFVIGAGVAGLQAIATAKRLGARVEAYDVRPAVKEQVQSLGAKFVELPIETAAAEDKGGYAKAQDEDFYRRQRELMGRVVAATDVVVTTAAIPGKKSPVLITADMVAGMAPGSVIVDLAAERGGNCELTRADEIVTAHDVTILGPTNLASTAPYHASQMYAKNITTFLLHLVKDERIALTLEDEITRDTLVAHAGEPTNARVREALGLPGATGGRTA